MRDWRRAWRRTSHRAWRALSGPHKGKAVGFALGWIAGWFGAATGLVVGFMIDALLSQRGSDRALAEYLENPGPSKFAERIPGAAAFCALCAIVVGADDGESGAIAPERIGRAARDLFGAGDHERAELEAYARTAAERFDRLNPDLLAESFCARARTDGDEKLREEACAILADLAEKPAARSTARRLARIIAPDRMPAGDAEDAEPYELLGLRPGASLREAKAAYRQLAVQFHPDAAAGLSEAQKKSAAEAFMRIDGAYRRITGKRGQQPEERSMRAPRPDRRATRDS